MTFVGPSLPFICSSAWPDLSLTSSILHFAKTQAELWQRTKKTCRTREVSKITKVALNFEGCMVSTELRPLPGLWLVLLLSVGRSGERLSWCRKDTERKRKSWKAQMAWLCCSRGSCLSMCSGGPSNTHTCHTGDNGALGPFSIPRIFYTDPPL